MFDPAMAKYFFPATTVDSETGDVVTGRAVQSPDPEGEVSERLNSFLDEADPAVLSQLITGMYPSPASFVN